MTATDYVAAGAMGSGAVVLAFAVLGSGLLYLVATALFAVAGGCLWWGDQ
jgi:hypothetical protein